MADRRVARHVYRLDWRPTPWWHYGASLPDELRRELAFWRGFIAWGLVVLAMTAGLWWVVAS